MAVSTAIAVAVAVPPDIGTETLCLEDCSSASATAVAAIIAPTEASIFSSRIVSITGGKGGGIFAIRSACVGSWNISGWSLIFQCPFVSKSKSR